MTGNPEATPLTIVLMGLRGSGKSSVGPLIGAHLGLPFHDLDTDTAALMGHERVADAWAAHGEPAFRKSEGVALRERLAHAGQVVALGGGTPLAPGATDILDRGARAGLRIVYLRATPATLRSRLRRADNTNRPSLTGADPLDEIETVFTARDPLYQRLATHIVDTDELINEAAVSDHVLDAIRS